MPPALKANPNHKRPPPTLPTSGLGHHPLLPHPPPPPPQALFKNSGTANLSRKTWAVRVNLILFFFNTNHFCGQAAVKLLYDTNTAPHVYRQSNAKCKMGDMSSGQKNLKICLACRHVSTCMLFLLLKFEPCPGDFRQSPLICFWKHFTCIKKILVLYVCVCSNFHMHLHMQPSKVHVRSEIREISAECTRMRALE